MARPRVYKVRPGPKRKTLADIEAGPITVIPEPQATEGQFKAVRASYSNKRKSAIIIWHYTHQISRYDARSNTYVLRKPRFRDTWTHFHSELKSQGVPFSTMAGWLDRKMADKILSSKATARTSDPPRKKASGGVIDQEANEEDDEEDVEDEEMEEPPSEEDREGSTPIPHGESEEPVLGTPSAPSATSAPPAISAISASSAPSAPSATSAPSAPSAPSAKKGSRAGGNTRRSCNICRERKIRCNHTPGHPAAQQFHNHGFPTPYIHPIQTTQTHPRPETNRTVKGPQPLKSSRPEPLRLPSIQYMPQRPSRSEEQGVGSFHQPRQPQPSPLGFAGQGNVQESGYLAQPQPPPPPSPQSTPNGHQEMRISHPVPVRHPSSVSELTRESSQRPSTCPPGQPHPLGTPPNHRGERTNSAVQPEAQQQQPPELHQRSPSSMTEPSGAIQAPNINSQLLQRSKEGQGVTLPSLVSQVALIPQRLQLMTQKSPIQRPTSQPQINRSQWPVVRSGPAAAASASQPQTVPDGSPLNEAQGRNSPHPAPQSRPQPGSSTADTPINQQMANSHLPPPQPWVPPPPRIIEHLPPRKSNQVQNFPPRPPQKLAPKPPHPIPGRQTTADLKTYHGSCHCSTVTFAVTCKPLPNPTHIFISCTCKTCSISNTLFLSSTNPSDSLSVTLLTGIDSLTHFHGRSFCKNCGVTLFSHASPELIERKSPNLIMLNVRCLSGLEIDDKLVVWKEWKEKGAVGKPSFVGMIN
ncbi:hypothetical protein HYALB_00003567 [Hymenoscyphus albidus]|uniref:CENP-V/GFA domain-containing protein n=1 Tax=Hymenoscyphus albidus TaxID=595503 RepID=A0A9N9LXV4_9HELO|nr:hypothetical protein HYALB_00003567 [Hymenoscyphus albidus]